MAGLPIASLNPQVTFAGPPGTQWTQTGPLKWEGLAPRPASGMPPAPVAAGTPEEYLAQQFEPLMQQVTSAASMQERQLLDSIKNDLDTIDYEFGLDAKRIEESKLEPEVKAEKMKDLQLRREKETNRLQMLPEIRGLRCNPFAMFDRQPIELWSAATQGAGGEPPAAVQYMTLNKGWW